LDFKTEGPRCISLNVTVFRQDQILFRREAQERGIAIAASIQWIKSIVNIAVKATATINFILSIVS
jgi:hypothetical protein